MSDRIPFFIYGSLRKSFENHDAYLKGKIDKEIPAEIKGTLYEVKDEYYPCLVKGKGIVIGEVVYPAEGHYNQVLKMLDQLEDYDCNNPENSLYIREKVEVETSGPERVTAWTYYWNNQLPIGVKVESGDWKKHREK
ncbi:gamma-glutamylcyclotransferase family protein [Pseudalkalibacillus caeni]|uniref:gamma-glutamylcyclotransferase family protein n=1 Tax=Exobacillus caeni TaxID=2574798 RepID=UPI0014850B25|nr:gamma-glutamylcyclotransferase family protein [Pseudalkalibacillus caeni]